MDQRVSMITLPVADVPAARAVYERLGWQVTFTDGDIVMFQAGGMILSLWWRDKLDVDGGVAQRGGYGRAALAYAVEDAVTFDAVVRTAIAAGATVTRRPGEKPFGYSGVFADPDGAHVGGGLGPRLEAARRRCRVPSRVARRATPCRSRSPCEVKRSGSPPFRCMVGGNVHGGRERLRQYLGGQPHRG